MKETDILDNETNFTLSRIDLSCMAFAYFIWLLRLRF